MAGTEGEGLAANVEDGNAAQGGVEGGDFDIYYDNDYDDDSMNVEAF